MTKRTGDGPYSTYKTRHFLIATSVMTFLVLMLPLIMHGGRA